MAKPKVGFYWCASCGGCEESVVDLAEGILDVVGAVDFVFFPVAMDFKRADVEALADGEIAVCFVNGAVRSSEQREMVGLLRRKSQLLIAYGACATNGGIPGLANLYDHRHLVGTAYADELSTVNPDGAQPQAETVVVGGKLMLPTLDASVKTLAQTVSVDYSIPGCAPPVALLKGALDAVLSGQLPPRGAVLAPDRALCSECSRLDSKPEQLHIEAFKRPHQVLIDPEQCLLAQGLLCLGPATRSGCGAACVQGNMPCTGCLGPVSRVRDHGAAALAALTSSLGAKDEDAVLRALEQVPDPAGLFYRYGLPGSMLFAGRANSNDGGAS